MKLADRRVSAPAFGLRARLKGVVLAPRDTFYRLLSEPRGLDVLALVSLATAACAWAFLSTPVGQQAYVDQRVVTLESFGIEVTDASYEQILRGAGSARQVRAAMLLVGVPVGSVALAALVVAIGRIGSVARPTFRQALAIVAHSGVVILIRQLVVTSLNYTRESMSNPSNLAIFFPVLDEGLFLTRLLGSIDIFILWWLLVLAIGFSVLLRQPTRRMAAWLIGLYGLLAASLASVITLLDVG